MPLCGKGFGACVECRPAAVEGAHYDLRPRAFSCQPVLGLGHERAQLVEHRRGRGTGEVQCLDAVESFEHPARFLHACDRSVGNVTDL